MEGRGWMVKEGKEGRNAKEGWAGRWKRGREERKRRKGGGEKKEKLLIRLVTKGKRKEEGRRKEGGRKEEGGRKGYSVDFAIPVCICRPWIIVGGRKEGSKEGKKIGRMRGR
jgi:hypothetical protein